MGRKGIPDAVGKRYMKMNTFGSRGLCGVSLKRFGAEWYHHNA